MITAESIIKANEMIKTTDIKGKDYAEVNQRIKAFRSICPEGVIETEILSLVDGVVTFKATIKDETGKVLATGHAQEKEGSTFINKTSFIENCETSACGRALGMLGIGVDTSIASAEEVLNAINNQGSKETKKAAVKEKEEMIDDRYILMTKQMLEIKGISEKSYLSFFNAKDIRELTMKQALDGVKKLSDKPDKVKKLNDKKDDLDSPELPWN